MKELNQQIETLLESANIDKQTKRLLAYEKALFPFSKQSSELAYLVSIGKLDFATYQKMMRDYSERNKYLELFDLAPRTFGQTWGEQHILNLVPEFVSATKENVSDVYPNFDGEFDVWHDGIRIEVKACRANSTKTKGSLASRAFLHNEALEAGFKYHFQQLKPSCCDVFIWIGVCRDELLYWVLTSDELQKTGKLGSQHRNENTGNANAAVFEGQVFMTEEELQPFLVAEKDILKVVVQKGKSVI